MPSPSGHFGLSRSPVFGFVLTSHGRHVDKLALLHVVNEPVDYDLVFAACHSGSKFRVLRQSRYKVIGYILAIFRCARGSF